MSPPIIQIKFSLFWLVVFVLLMLNAGKIFSLTVYWFVKPTTLCIFHLVVSQFNNYVRELFTWMIAIETIQLVALVSDTNFIQNDLFSTHWLQNFSATIKLVHRVRSSQSAAILKPEVGLDWLSNRKWTIILSCSVLAYITRIETIEF